MSGDRLMVKIARLSNEERSVIFNNVAAFKARFHPRDWARYDIWI